MTTTRNPGRLLAVFTLLAVAAVVTTVVLLGPDEHDVIADPTDRDEPAASLDGAPGDPVPGARRTAIAEATDEAGTRLRFEVRRPHPGGVELVGLATADDRIRSSTRFEAGSLTAEVAWNRDLGPPALLWSDRRMPRVLAAPDPWPPADGDPPGRLELSRGLDVTLRVPADAISDLHVVCRVRAAATHVYDLARPDGDAVTIVGIEPECGLRVIDTKQRRMSAWHAAGEVAAAERVLPLELAATGTRVVAAGSSRSVPQSLLEARDEAGHAVDVATSLADGIAYWHAMRPVHTLAADAPGHAPEEVAPHASPTGDLQTIELRAARDLRVLVSRIDAAGTPRPARNGVLHWSGPWARRATIRDGVALLRDLPLEALDLTLLEGSHRSSTTVPEQVEEFVWELAAATTLRGRLTCRWTGDARFAVLVAQGELAPRPVFPDDTGLFEAANVPDEDLELSVVAVFGPGHEIVVHRRTAHPRRFAQIDLSAEHLPGSSLTGQILAADGTPAPATVRLRHVDPAIPRRELQFAEDGEFAFERIPAGDYQLEAQPATWPVAVTRRIQVGPGSGPPLRWQLPTTATLTIHLEGATGDLGSAQVMFRRPGDPEWIGVERDAASKAFVIPQLLPGTYEARIGRATGLAPLVEQFEVFASPPTQAATLTALPGLPCHLLVSGLGWDRCECVLLATSRDGRFRTRIHKEGDSSNWNVTLAPGTFDLEFLRGLERRRSSVDVVDLGGESQLRVHAW